MKFTDLLDNYLLALGTFNQAYAACEADPIRFAQAYRDASAQLMTIKAELNEYIENLGEKNKVLLS